MRLSPVALPASLEPFVHAMWVFESDDGLPSGDARVVVPNGRAKLIVPWRNGLSAEGGGRRQTHREGDVVLIGLWDAPTVISSAPEPTVSIGIEFTPNGLCRFVASPANELSQRIEPIGHVLGAAGDRLVSRVMAAATVGEAVDVVRAFLAERFRLVSRPQALLVDEALRLMTASGFRMDGRELERRMGYSGRYLVALFQRDIGLSPKRLNSILAFERLYRSFSNHRSVENLRADALDLFYDQSHFIRHFKQFAGVSPGRFAEMDNEFGRIFYRPSRTGDLSSSDLSNP